jgi:hypothetical protein
MEKQARVILDDTKRSPYVFQSGDIAVVSGLYRPDHSKCDTSPAIRIAKGERFPVCPQCGETANFLLERKLDTLKSAQVVPINR